MSNFSLSLFPPYLAPWVASVMAMQVTKLLKETCLYSSQRMRKKRGPWEPEKVREISESRNIEKGKHNSLYKLTHYGAHSLICTCLELTQGTSLLAQWLRIHLPMQGTRVLALAWEDPTCHGATKQVHHNYWACALEPKSHNYWAHMPQLLKPVCLEPMPCNKRSHNNEKPAHHNEE